MFSFKKQPTINDLIKSYKNTQARNTKNIPKLRNIKTEELRRLHNKMRNMVNINRKQGGTMGNRNNVQKIVKPRNANAGRCTTLRLQKEKGFRLSIKNKTFLAGCAVGAGAKRYGAQAKAAGAAAGRQAKAGLGKGYYAAKQAGSQTIAGARYLGGKASNAAMKAGKKFSQKRQQIQTGYNAYKTHKSLNNVERTRKKLNSLQKKANKAQKRLKNRMNTVGLVPQNNRKHNRNYSNYSNSNSTYRNNN